MSIFNIVLIVAALASIVTLIIIAYIFATPASPRGLRDEVAASLRTKAIENQVGLEAVATFEKSLPAYSTVIVLAHEIENPTKKMRDAVIDNFQQGVRYVFLTSKSQFNANVEKFEGFFRALFTVASTEAPRTGENSIIRDQSFERVCVIAPLSGEWSSWPYILYRYRTAEKVAKIVVFRGSKRQEGISDRYAQLDPIEAEAFFNAMRLAIASANIDFMFDDEKIEFDNVLYFQDEAKARIKN